MSQKQLSMAAAAQVIWYVRMPDRGLVFEYVTSFHCFKGVTFVVDCVKCADSHSKKRKQDDPPQWVAQN